MTEPIQYAILGLGSGSIYALLAFGLVLIYRGSGTINLAHGHFAVLAAYLTYQVGSAERLDAPIWVAAIVSIAVCAAVGGAVQLLVMRPLRTASPLARVIATLGVLTIINEALTLAYGADQRFVKPILPTSSVSIGSFTFSQGSLWLMGIAVVAMVVLELFSRRSRLGLAISASAENPSAASALGWSPDMLAMFTWIAGGALAGLAGVLVTTVAKGYFNIGSLSFLIVSGLACALFAQFKSYGLALFAGWFIAVAQSEATRYIDITGLGDVIPLAFIVLVLVVRGRGLPVRGLATDRLPNVGSGRIRPGVVIPLTVVVVFLILRANDFDKLQAVVIAATTCIVALSIVVLTGYAGQLSLAQMALAGIGAYAAGRLVAGHGWTFGPALIIGVLVAAAAGFVFGLPALRTRGVNLTVVTFGMGFAVFAALFSSTKLTGGNSQTVIPDQKLFGWQIDTTLNLNHYAAICAIAFVVAAIGVANLRRGRTGRRLLAVRANERAAASLGVSVFSAKLYAFTLAAAIAGLGGVLYAFSYPTILYGELFGPFTSINVLTVAVVGGIGWVAGPVWGSTIAAGGISVILFGAGNTDTFKYLPLAGGVLLIVLLIVSQNGLAAAVSRLVPEKWRRWRLRPPAPDHEAGDPVPIKQESLVVEGIVQKFGGVTALDGVSVALEPGRVLGLMGPNGAGKTTLIDVVTGYARPTSGRVNLAGTDVTRWAPSRRARRGLGRTFQALELFDDLTVRENLLAASEKRDFRAYLTDLVWPGRARMTATTWSVVQEMGIEDLLDSRPDELSYGQRRLVAIARTVAMRPSVVLLDEPGAGLDENETRELGVLVRRLADEWGMAVLLIEHDVAMVLEVADHVLVLEHGTPIFDGAPEQFAKSDRVRKAFLGVSLEEESQVAQ